MTRGGFAPLETVANAVLYEGFLLYPYRKSNVKNQKRFQFGTLGPSDTMQTQCLVEGDGRTSLSFKIRFLQGDCEREIELAGPAGKAVQRFGELVAAVEWESRDVQEGLFRFTVKVENLSRECGEELAMISTHSLLAVEGGFFVSLMDPPERYRVAAEECKNIGTWPVLGGEQGRRTLMLSSPIILYDYPQIAAGSVGNFFDSTEIDEMLSLRVLTLSDGEKREIRDGDGRGREILERTETLQQGAFERLHGVVQPALRKGDRVRLHPRKRADIFDIALDGKVAIVEAVERDFEDRVHLAVTIVDDPGRDLGVAGQIGHRFFFGLEEVELL